jgi:Sigma-70, region 4
VAVRHRDEPDRAPPEKRGSSPARDGPRADAGSDTWRSALLLYAWEELSYEEIATALDVPIGTVRSRINCARRRRPGLNRSPRSAFVSSRTRNGVVTRVGIAP